MQCCKMRVAVHRGLDSSCWCLVMLLGETSMAVRVQKENDCVVWQRTKFTKFIHLLPSYL